MKKWLITFAILLMGTLTVFGQDDSVTESGIELYRAGNFQQAIEVLLGATEARKGDKLAWVYLGGSYLQIGNEKEAMRAFRKSNLDYTDSLGSFDRPLKTLRKPHPRYTHSARRNKVTGVVRVAVEFKADGSIGFVFPFDKLPEGLTESSITAANSIAFEPAVKNGKPVDTISVITYTFAIY